MILEKEINFIQDERLRNAIRKCVDDRAEILKWLPASVSGKYHPPDERGPGGFIRHIKKCVWYVRGAQLHLALSEEETDKLLVAAILHDISNCDISRVGEEGQIERDLKKYEASHPKLSAQITAKYLIAEGFDWLDPTLMEILDIIESHMAHWYPDCGQPLTKLEIILTMADYFTTRTAVQIDWEGEI
ncbi:MAG: HD domain-containing protein [Candidatus Bathyarchaeia archaeon]